MEKLKTDFHKTKEGQRTTALQAARSIIRYNKFDFNPDVALKVLDDLLRTEPHTIAAKWYKDASENQIALFKKEFKKWECL